MQMGQRTKERVTDASRNMVRKGPCGSDPRAERGLSEAAGQQTPPRGTRDTCVLASALPGRAEPPRTMKPALRAFT